MHWTKMKLKNWKQMKIISLSL